MIGHIATRAHIRNLETINVTKIIHYLSWTHRWPIFGKLYLDTYSTRPQLVVMRKNTSPPFKLKTPTNIEVTVNEFLSLQTYL